MRLEAARLREQTAQSELNIARAVVKNAQEAHDELVRELTPQPRNKTEKATASAPAQKDPPAVVPGTCSYKYPNGNGCFATADNAIHDKSMGYAGYHPFEPAKPVARAPRKSKQKPGDTLPVPSSEIEPETAIAAGAGD